MVVVVTAIEEDRGMVVKLYSICIRHTCLAASRSQALADLAFVMVSRVVKVCQQLKQVINSIATSGHYTLNQTQQVFITW